MIKEKKVRKIKTQEDLYALMQRVSRSALYKFRYKGLEPDELANELFIMWSINSKIPKKRRPMRNGKPTVKSIVLKIPIKESVAYCVILNDAKDFLKTKIRKSIHTIGLEAVKNI